MQTARWRKIEPTNVKIEIGFGKRSNRNGGGAELGGGIFGAAEKAAEPFDRAYAQLRANRESLRMVHPATLHPVSAEATKFVRTSTVIVQCGHCSALGYQHDKFCASCGHELTRSCSLCGQPIQHPVANYCTQCGTPLSAGTFQSEHHSD